MDGLAPGAARSLATELRETARPAPNVRNLSVLAYAQGFTLWHYRAADLRAAERSDYFGFAHDMMAPGDMVLVSSPIGGMIRMVVGPHGATAPLAA